MLTQLNAVVLLLGALVVQAQLWWLAECSLTAHRRQHVLPWFTVYLSVRIGFRVAQVVLPHQVPALDVAVAAASWVCTLILMWRLWQANRDSAHHLNAVLQKRDAQEIILLLERYVAKYPSDGRHRPKEDTAHAG